MKKNSQREESFLDRAVLWTLRLFLVLVIVLVSLQRYQMALGLVIGQGTYLSILLFYRRFVQRFAQPTVQKQIFQRLLVVVAMLKYPFLLLITYLVVQLGMETTLGFLGGVSLMMFVLVGMAIREGSQGSSRGIES